MYCFSNHSLQTHPFVPLIQSSHTQNLGSVVGHLKDFDQIFFSRSDIVVGLQEEEEEEGREEEEEEEEERNWREEILKEMLELMKRVLKSEVVPLMVHRNNSDFQIPRGIEGVSL